MGITPEDIRLIQQGNARYNQWRSQSGAATPAGRSGPVPIVRPGAGVGCTLRTWTDPDTGQIRTNTNLPRGQSLGQDPNWTPNASYSIDRQNRVVSIDGESYSYNPIQQKREDKYYPDKQAWDDYSTRIGVVKAIPRPGQCTSQRYNTAYNALLAEIGGPLNDPAVAPKDTIVSAGGWSDTGNKDSYGRMVFRNDATGETVAPGRKSSKRSSSRNTGNDFGMRDFSKPVSSQGSRKAPQFDFAQEFGVGFSDGSKRSTSKRRGGSMSDPFMW